jgi:glycosyltransferase involved in cell wall biosynthesis
VEIPGISVDLTHNLWEDLSTASVFVYKSDLEGLGSAALAAMAAGVPVVASGVGGLPEAVDHGRTGFIVTDGDFFTPVRRFLDVPQLAATMGRSGRERVQQEFSVDGMVTNTLRAYREVLGRGEVPEC